MKKVTLILLIISLVLIESCSEDFDINAPYEDIYVLNCILQNENSIQYAVLSKNIYTESGGYPPSTGTDQYIKGAKIKILYNNSVFVMRDTTLQIINDGNFIKVNCYYLEDLILEPGRIISIEATAPNGKILKSTIQSPRIVFPDYPFYFPPGGFLTGYLFFGTYNWSWKVNNIASTDIISLPQLEIYYKKYEGGIFVEKKIVVPLGSIIIPYEETPYFVNAEPSYICKTQDYLAIINTKMMEISGNDPNKQNYIIEKATFSVLCIDPLLSQYYSENTTYSQNFSIKLYPPELSNIEGGKGIFGMYNKFSTRLIIDNIYVQSFGYQYKPY